MASKFLLESSRQLTNQYGVKPIQWGARVNNSVNNTAVKFNKQKGYSDNFLGNVVKSLGTMGGQALGAVGGAAKQMLWDEPGALIKHVTGNYGQLQRGRQDALAAAGHLKDIQRRMSQGQQVSLQEINAARDRALGGQRSMQQAATSVTNLANPLSKEYREKYLPVALTGATIATLGTTAPLTSSIKGGGALAKTARFGARFGDDLFGIGAKFGKNIPMNIAGKLARTQLLVKPTVNDIGMLPGQIASGKYGDAAINAALLASGGLKNGPIGSTRNLLTAISKKTGNLFGGKAGVFDMVKIKNGSVYDVLQKVAKKDPGRAEQATKTLRIYQDYLTQQWGSPKVAAQALQEYIGNKDLSKMTLKTLTKELDNFRNSDVAIRKTAVKLAKAGKLTDEAGKKITVEQAKHVGAVRSPAGQVNKLATKLSTTTNQQQLDEAIEGFAKKNPQFMQNQQNSRILRGIQEEGLYGDDAVKRINASFRKTDQVFTDEKKMLEGAGGFTGGFRSGVNFNKLDDTADLQHGKDTIFSKIGGALERTGLSPSSSSEGKAKLISSKIRTNMDEALSEAGVNRSASEILSKLRTKAETNWGVFDVRQLRASEIADAVGVDKATAKKILGAYKKSIMKLTAEERGLAGKLTDLNLNYNPLAGPYSRAQNALKYEKNPFFSIQERIETRLGTAAITGKTRMPGRDYSNQVKELEKAGFWENAGFGSEGADIGNITNITSKLKRGQKETLAAGIDQMASKQGKSITEFITDPKNADLMQDFKTVVQYPDKGFTSSNLSKMLNLVAFPTRYNIKIAQFAIKQLAKQPGLVQAQVLRSLGDYNEFMTSPEGIKFQADNKEVMGLFNYFTPMGNIQQVMNVFRGQAKQPADFGLIGGLPFGVITQALQGQGLIKTDTPYVDPRTGEIYADKIPQNLKARAYQLLGDVLGTMYNYPGRIVGLPAKKDFNNIPGDFLLGKPEKGDFKSVTRTNVSDDDRKRMEVLGGGNKLQEYLDKPIVELPKLSGKQNLTIAPIYKKSKSKGKFVRPKSVPIQRLINR